MKKNKYRFNLELAPMAEGQLNELQKSTGAASVTEVIRRALVVYDVLENHKEDWEIVLRNKKNKREKVVVLV